MGDGDFPCLWRNHSSQVRRSLIELVRKYSFLIFRCIALAQTLSPLMLSAVAWSAASSLDLGSSRLELSSTVHLAQDSISQSPTWMKRGLLLCDSKPRVAQSVHRTKITISHRGKFGSLPYRLRINSVPEPHARDSLSLQET